MSVESAAAEDLRMDAGALIRALWSRTIRIIVVTLLLLGVTYGVLLFVPKQYESVASLLVEDRSNAITEPASASPAPQQGGGGVSIDALISSQIELIRSRDTLLAVVDQLNLRSVPEFNGTGSNPLTLVLSILGHRPEPRTLDDSVLQALNDRLTVIRERDSAVVSIYVRAGDPELAAKIANAIAAEHVKRRTQQSVTDTQDATAWLQQQIDQLRTKVQQEDAKVADYKASNGIFPGANGTSLPDQQISDIGKQITDAQAALNTAREHADLIRSLIKAGQPIDGVDDVRASPVVQALLQNRATLQSSLAEKSATLLPAHPTIIALKAQIAQVDSQIMAEATHIADGLDAQVKVQTGLIASLNDDLKNAQGAASTQTRDGVTLDSLTREANADRDLLNSYLLKGRDAQGRTDAGAVLPDVRIITQAAPSVVPASPKTGLILGAVAAVSLALQIGAVLFGELMSGRAVYDRSVVRHVEPAHEETVPTDDESADEEILAEDEIDREESDAVMPATEAEAVLARAEAETPFSRLSADITLGRVRVVYLAGVSDGRDAAIAADALVTEALDKGLNVCRVDAGSMHMSQQLGLSDLCAGQASYGDVVHKVRVGLAEVPWGRGAALDRRSPRPLTLLEALSDIYELVVVSTGRVGLNSTLPLFAGADGRVVMVKRPGTAPATLDAMTAEVSALGFGRVQNIVLLDHIQAAAA